MITEFVQKTLEARGPRAANPLLGRGPRLHIPEFGHAVTALHVPASGTSLGVPAAPEAPATARTDGADRLLRQAHYEGGKKRARPPGTCTLTFTPHDGGPVETFTETSSVQQQEEDEEEQRRKRKRIRRSEE